MTSYYDILLANGIDCAGIKNRFSGNLDMYLSLLNMFLDDPNMDILCSAVDCNDLQQSFNAAHTLAGVSANLGFTTLFNSLRAILVPLRQCDASANYRILLRNVFFEYSKVRTLINAINDITNNW